MQRSPRGIEDIGGLRPLDHKGGEEYAEDEHVAEQEYPGAILAGNPPRRRRRGRCADRHAAAVASGRSAACSAPIDWSITTLTAIIQAPNATSGIQNAMMPFHASGPSLKI